LRLQICFVPTVRALGGFGLGGFVVDGGSDLVHKFGWNVGHFVVSARVFGDYHENFPFAVAAGNKIAVRSNVSTTHSFWHGTS
jgi:hypothetical protein